MFGRILPHGSQQLKIELGRIDTYGLDQFQSDILSLCDDRHEQMFGPNHFRVELVSMSGCDPHDLLASGGKALVIEERQVGRVYIEL